MTNGAQVNSNLNRGVNTAAPHTLRLFHSNGKQRNTVDICSLSHLALKYKMHNKVKIKMKMELKYD